MLDWFDWLYVIFLTSTFKNFDEQKNVDILNYKIQISLAYTYYYIYWSLEKKNYCVWFSEKFLSNVLGKIPRFLFPLVFFLSLVMRIRGSSWGVSPQQESLESYFWLPWVFNHWKKCNHLVWYNLVYDTIPLLKKREIGRSSPQ